MSAGHVPSTALSSSLSWGAPPPWQAEPLCLAPSSTVPSSPALDSELGFIWHQPQALSQQLLGASMGEWVMVWAVIFGGQSSAGRSRGWQVFGALWRGLLVCLVSKVKRAQKTKNQQKTLCKYIEKNRLSHTSGWQGWPVCVCVCVQWGAQHSHTLPDCGVVCTDFCRHRETERSCAWLYSDIRFVAVDGSGTCSAPSWRPACKQNHTSLVFSGFILP